MQARHNLVSKGALGLSAISSLVGFTPAALAQGFQPGLSHAAQDQIGMMQPASAMAADMASFHNNLLLPIIIVISLFVLGLLIYVMIRFNETANPTLKTTIAVMTALGIALTATVPTAEEKVPNAA